MRDLADAGLRPYVNVAPAYPFTTAGPREWAAALKAAGAARVNIWSWAYLDGVLPAVRAAGAGTAAAAIADHVADPEYQAHLARALAAACRREGLPVATDAPRLRPRGA